MVASTDMNARIPVIDMAGRRVHVSELIVKACEEYGFFMVTNHGVPEHVMARMEAIGTEFFSLPGSEKQRAGPASPLGYGMRSIGNNGDTGELEYLLLHASPTYISLRARTICKKNPMEFSYVVNEYVEAMRRLSCEILELLSEGLKLEDSRVFSRLIKDTKSDSLLRINHYPPSSYSQSNQEDSQSNLNNSRVGFGEHTDPQILTILRSTIAGLQIMHPPRAPDGGAWVPVQPDPTAFCVHVGDVLQATTNSRLVSVKHRAMVKSYTARMSLVFFAAPPPQALIYVLEEMIQPGNPRQYRSFTWGEYKKAMYSLRLGQNRLSRFQIRGKDEDSSNL